MYGIIKSIYRKAKSPKSIFDCITLLSTAQFVFCCGSIWNHKGHLVSNKWTRSYSLIGAVLVLICLALSLFIVLNDHRFRAGLANLDRLVLSIAALEIIMSSTCMFTATVISMQNQAQRQLKLFKDLNDMDRRLMMEFGSNMNYHKIVRKNAVVLATFICLYASSIGIAMVELVHKNIAAWILGSFCYIFVTAGPHLCGYTHMNLAEFIRIRFSLMQIIIDERYLCRNFANLELRLQRLESAVLIVKELFWMIDEVNVIYRKVLLAAMAHDFTLTTSQWYFIFGRSMRGQSSSRTLIYVGLWMLPSLYKMSMCPIYCTRTIKEGEKCLEQIKRIDTWFPKNQRIQDLVSSVLLWRIGHPIEFVFGLNIRIDKLLITTVLFVILNYLLILVQFRMMEELGEQVEDQKKIIQQWIHYAGFNITLESEPYF